MNLDAKIYVAGHRGMVGSAIVRELQRKGYNNLLLRTHAQLDLCNQSAVNNFFTQERPEYVFLAAAKVGGIVANQTAPADFMYQNMMNGIHTYHNSFILCHDIKDYTVKMMDRFLTDAIKEGYTFMPITSESIQCHHGINN